MKRDMLCVKCAERSYQLHGRGETVDRDEHVKHVEGVMIRARPEPITITRTGFGKPPHTMEIAASVCVCDGCMTALPRGTRVVARSIWSTVGGLPYVPWEHEFIDVA